MTIRTATGTEEQPVPDARVSQPVLDDAQAAALARFGSQVEALYGMPMDIEWALAEGSFVLLQARPITTLQEAPLAWPLPHPKGFYMRTSGGPDARPAQPPFATPGIPALVTQAYPASGNT
jgi:pyruvate,water dikinase